TTSGSAAPCRCLRPGKDGAAPMMRGRRGNMVLEVAMWMPVLLLLIAGVIQFGKITYLYYTLRKIEYSVARSVSIANGANFCPDAGDTLVQGAIEFALTGTSDGSGTPLVSNLTPGIDRKSVV